MLIRTDHVALTENTAYTSHARCVYAVYQDWYTRIGARMLADTCTYVQSQYLWSIDYIAMHATDQFWIDAQSHGMTYQDIFDNCDTIAYDMRLAHYR